MLFCLVAGQFTNYPYVSASAYNAAGQPKRFELGNGLVARFGYYGYSHFQMGSDLDDHALAWGARSFGRLIQHCVGPASATCPLISSGPEAMNWSYWYDLVGNVENIRDAINANQLLTFDYDPLDRLMAAGTTATGAGAYVTRTYEYNPLGNLTRFEGASYGYQGGKPHAVTHVDGVQKYGYDPAGNLTSRDGASLTWDAENRLETVTEGGRVTTFVYDADGRRVKKETPWGTTYYVGDHYERYVPASGLSTLPGDANADCRVSAVDVQLIAARWGQKWGDAGYGLPYDVDQDGKVTAGDLQATAANWRATVASPCTNIPVVTKYYKLGERLVALRQNGVLRYVHTDHLGSVSLLTDADGKAVPGSVQRFYPFGKTRAGQPVLLPTERNFTGQLLDANTGLLYYGSSQGYGRYYDPALARFVQPDILIPNPGDPQQLNRYAYANNNPLKYRDPSGHWFETAWDILNIGWDIYEVRRDPSLVNIGALVVDVGAAVLPFVPAGSARSCMAARQLRRPPKWRMQPRQSPKLKTFARLVAVLKSPRVCWTRFCQGSLILQRDSGGRSMWLKKVRRLWQKLQPTVVRPATSSASSLT